MNSPPSFDPSSSAPREAIRLQKFLAMAGAGSRRHCEEFIVTGRVTVDGRTVTELGARVDPATQLVRLDGERVRLERPVYYLLNKPTGVLCTNYDPAGRPRVIDFFPQDRERLFTVGRLDENSQGLMLVTNDGELAHRLAHPRFRVRKVYRVQVAGVPSREILEQLKQGVHFAEGRFKVAEATLVKVKGASALVEIVLTEGQNREIRRLLAKLGHKVQRLTRVALGPLRLGDVPAGHFRPLAAHEVAALRDLASGAARRRRSQGGKRTKTGSRRERETARGRRNARSSSTPLSFSSSSGRRRAKGNRHR